MSKILTVKCDHDCENDHIHKSQTKKEFQDPALESLAKELKQKYSEMQENMLSEIFTYLGLSREDLSKGMNGHKYVKRTGGPGNYKYWYKLPDGRVVEGDDAPKGHPHHSSNDDSKKKTKTKKIVVTNVDTQKHLEDWQESGMIDSRRKLHNTLLKPEHDKNRKKMLDHMAKNVPNKIINGERNFLLHRGVGDKDQFNIDNNGSHKYHDVYSFSTKADKAREFARERYTNFVSSVWVPESSISLNLNHSEKFGLKNIPKYKKENEVLVSAGEYQPASTLEKMNIKKDDGTFGLDPYLENNPDALNSSIHNSELADKIYGERFKRQIESKPKTVVVYDKASPTKPKQNFGKVTVKPASAERKVTFNADIGNTKLQMNFEAADKSDIPFKSKHPDTNLVKEVRFGSTDNGTQIRLNNALQDAESVMASVGIKFKRALNFYCGYMDSKGGVNAAYSISNHNVGLHSDKTIEKSLMHEIGHAIDFSISKTSKTNVSHFAQAAMLPGPSLEKSIMEAVKLSPMYQEALKNPKRYEYLTQPTEMFARAFEVFALEKAKKLAREGKANQTFAKNYFPDVYKNITDPKQFQAMQKIATMMEELLKKTPIRKSVEWAP